MTTGTMCAMVPVDITLPQNKPPTFLIRHGISFLGTYVSFKRVKHLDTTFGIAVSLGNGEVHFSGLAGNLRKFDDR